MSSLLDVLGGLLAFDFLKQINDARGQRSAADDFAISLMPRNACRDCDDAVYMDMLDRQPDGTYPFKHLSTRTVMRQSGPDEGGFARPHPARWLVNNRQADKTEEDDAWHGTTDRVLTASHSPRPR